MNYLVKNTPFRLYLFDLFDLIDLIEWVSQEG